MPNFFLQSLRLSYAQRVLPLIRMTVAGGVLVILALLAGFGAPGPATPARAVAPTRGPLIDVTEHPEWKQFLIQAAYRRSDELGRLKDLPDTPTIMSAPVIIEVPQSVPEPQQPSAQEPSPSSEPQQVAALSPGLDDTLPVDPTGSIEASLADLPIDIGEASAAELPITIQDLPIPIERPQTLKRFNETHRITKPAKRRQAKAQRPPAAQTQPAQQSDFFSSLFGGNSQASSSPSR
jgi:hypothetical protein